MSTTVTPGVFYIGEANVSWESPGVKGFLMVGVSPEVLGIVQGAIVLFIAAPPLVRALFRLPALSSTPGLDRLRARFRRKGASS